jgi:predicted RNA-binding protein
MIILITIIKIDLSILEAFMTKSAASMPLPGRGINLKSAKYWVIVASRDRVQRGVQGGFIQACHGKSSPLKRMRVGDWVLYYSPKREFENNEKCQAFTAIGKVTGNNIYSFDMGNSFIPYRRDVEFLNCIEVSILPLIPQLSFIRNKINWGYVFRSGFFEIQKDDFDLITNQMLLTQTRSI